MLCCYDSQLQIRINGGAVCRMEEIMREPDYSKMGMRIRQIRKAKGWSQDDLAKRCGISMSFLGHIERGTRIMSLETFTALCEALGAGADELLFGIAHPSDALAGLWQSTGKKAAPKTGTATEEKSADSYAMYVRIMKSVAEIMNEA